MSARAGAVLFGALALLMLATPQSTAHIRTTTGHGVLTSTDTGATLTLSLQYDFLARAAGLGAGAIDAPDDAARAAALAARESALSGYLGDRVMLSVDGAGCEPTLDSSGVETRSGRPYATAVLAFACPGGERGAYALSYEVFRASDGVVDDHILVLDYELGGESGETFLNRAYHTLSTGEQSVVGTSARFAGLGIDRVLHGLDHLLIVAALLLGARSLTDVLGTMSVFTLASSLTLGLAVIGWVEPPWVVAQPLIALSSVYVAADNLVGEPSRHRLGIVFGAGLLHGFGFAEAVRMAGDVTWVWAGSLLSFNLGIEIGLALLVLAVFPLLVLVRRLRWSVTACAGATSCVAFLGLVSFFERVTVT